MQRSNAIQRRVCKAMYTTAKRYSGDHVAAQNPIFKQTDGTPFSNLWYNGPVNTVYGPKFHHPKNYQGNVPVTAQVFDYADPAGSSIRLNTVLTETRAPATWSFSIPAYGLFAVGFPLLGAYLTIDLLNKWYANNILPYNLQINRFQLIKRMFLLQNGDLYQLTEEDAETVKKIWAPKSSPNEIKLN